MRLKTREGVLLLVSVGWDENYPQEPVIWFRFDNQQLCSSYFISTFQGIPDDEGLCLDGGVYDRKTLSAMQVRSCKRFIQTCQLLRSKARNAPGT
jgi:hypothetical protein